MDDKEREDQKAIEQIRQMAEKYGLNFIEPEETAAKYARLEVESKFPFTEQELEGWRACLAMSFADSIWFEYYPLAQAFATIDMLKARITAAQARIDKLRR